MTGITQIDEDTFETIFRGRVFTLVRDAQGWCMWNKPVNGFSNPPKPFKTLEDVESKYKHWAGISQLLKN